MTRLNKKFLANDVLALLFPNSSTRGGAAASTSSIFYDDTPFHITPNYHMETLIISYYTLKRVVNTSIIS